MMPNQLLFLAWRGKQWWEKRQRSYTQKHAASVESCNMALPASAALEFQER